MASEIMLLPEMYMVFDKKNQDLMVNVLNQP